MNQATAKRGATEDKRQALGRQSGGIPRAAGGVGRHAYRAVSAEPSLLIAKTPLLGELHVGGA